jgi:hypothetical protein
MQGNAQFVVVGMIIFLFIDYFLNSTYVPAQITLPFLFFLGGGFLFSWLPVSILLIAVLFLG